MGERTTNMHDGDIVQAIDELAGELNARMR